MIVAKVGGSLYDDPRLGPALRAWLGEQPEPVLLVPGGGGFADAVRELDRVHRLGEEAAHYLALTSLWAAMQFLKTLVPGAEFCPHPCAFFGDVMLLDPDHFCKGEGDLPHTWAVTTDSIALAAAIAGNASKLVLLKSTDVPPGTPWPVAAANGWVDGHFPELAAEVRFPIEVLNFRRWADARFGEPAS